MENLEDIRKQIDSIDNQIVELLNRRMDAVKRVAESKGVSGKAVRDSRRESAIIDRLVNQFEGETKQVIPEIYEAIFNTSRKFQDSILNKNGRTYSKKIMVINGVNLDMLGKREPHLYGRLSYADLVQFIESAANKMNVLTDCRQSNYEGEIVEFIHECLGNYDGIIINAGAYTHTSIAILDALKSVSLPTVEVHITDINERESYRKFSYISEYANKVIVGKGFDGYAEALEYLINN